VDTGFFHPASNEEKMATRSRLGIPADKTILLYVGRLNAIKGVDVLLHGWSLVPGQVRDNTRLVLVGGDADNEDLLNMVASLRIDESVVLVGTQKAVRDYYWAADVFVLASRTEGLSVALLEAMACGLPVVASRVGGTPDVVQDDVNGLLFESENCSQLAQRLASMVTKRDSWADMGAHARQSVIDYADMDACVRQMSDLYVQLSCPRSEGG
jgi:glycosyltransferase involved in cell wall biosynthesis